MATTTQDRVELEQVTILFSGDSGDGMQLTGTQFTNTSATLGNDVSTLPDYPSEIRAPAGSLAGVSAFQLSFASKQIRTPGDQPDVLVAMNPAALKVYLPRLRPGGVLVVNRDAFSEANLKKAGYAENPLDAPELPERFQVHAVPINTLTLAALEDVDLEKRSKQRSKNLFALGLLYWLYDRPIEPTRDWIGVKFGKLPVVAEANRRALEAGYRFGETDLVAPTYSVPPSPTEPGKYRIISGNEAFALGSVTAARLANKPLVYCSYPITPATDVLHELARLKHLDVRTIQAEDEIAAMGAAIGAAFGGAFAMTGTSGPGVCLKGEALGLAIMLELPLVILNVQRGGPSTGLPTKTEQADLLQALVGRNGESPIPVLATASPADCFDVAIEAFRIAVRHTTPVFVLSDSYVGNGAKPWRIPRFEEMEPIAVEHPTEPQGFLPYARAEGTLARPWAIPGTPGLEHRLGGLEKQHETGDVSHDATNHELMCRLRAEKIERIAEFAPEQEVAGPSEGDLLVVSWGGTAGAVGTAVSRSLEKGRSVAHAHLRYLHPFPRNLGDVLSRYERVLVPELNRGQLSLLLRGRFLVDAAPLSKMRGRPFTIAEIEAEIEELSVMTTATLTRRDFASDQAVRWCPGCGDYAILAQVQKTLPELGHKREDVVFISGIGCSSRFPYYMNTYGIHSIHGRAPTLALGLKCARPELQIWVVTGDGDALAIGGNHFLHALRRNVDINILLVNNRIYGLTKGQYSPTSEVGKRTKSSPDGSIEHPVNPTGVAIGAEASFIARTVAPFQKHMAAVIDRAARHTGACLVEIEQNCVIFNDGAWNHLTEPDSKSDHVLFLEHGKPLRFGKNMEKGIRLNGLSPEVVDVVDVGEDALLVHDEQASEPTLAYFLSRMGPPDFPTPVGVFRAVEKPVYDELLMEQVRTAQAGNPPDLNELYRRGESWEIQARRSEGTLCPSCDHPNFAGADECELCLASLAHEHLNLDERLTRLEESLYGDTVAALEPSPATALAETETVDVALRTLRENNIGCVLVTDGEGRLSGIVTERDLLHRMADELDPTAHRLAEVMTPAPETVRPEHSLAHAAHRMTISDLRYLPLVDEDGRPERIVDSRDLVGYLAALVLAEGTE